MTAEKTLEEIIAETNAEIELSETEEQARLEATLPDIRDLRDAKTDIEKLLKVKEQPVRDWLARNQDMQGPLFWEKGHITAKLTERHGADVYSTDRMPDDLILLLHKIGALKVDSGVIKASKNEEVNDRVKAFKRPGPVSQVLEVKRDE